MLLREMFGEKKIKGGRAIREYLGWSHGKFFRNLDKLKEKGAVWIELYGRPPRRYLCSYPSKLEDYKER
ncbi:MAG: hypothetical protein JXA50_01710 [Deltaproteobacteria bacterium]|nr:hypothetical protein [Deltaproteobacteria bacterium]